MLFCSLFNCSFFRYRLMPNDSSRLKRFLSQHTAITSQKIAYIVLIEIGKIKNVLYRCFQLYIFYVKKKRTETFIHDSRNLRKKVSFYQHYIRCAESELVFLCMWVRIVILFSKVNNLFLIGKEEVFFANNMAGKYGR